MRRQTLLGVIAVVAALLAATMPPPPAWVEMVYADRLYPPLQTTLTGASNLTRVPLFDVVLALTIVGSAIALAAGVRRAWRARSAVPLARLAGRALVLASLFYLWFVIVWGLSYRRPPIESALADVVPGRVTSVAVRLLAERAVAEANRLYEPAHAQGFPAMDAVPPALLASLHAVERELGRPRPTRATRPKRPLTAPYMRAVGVSGMLAPFFLETYLNPDLTGPERPAVLAHEWAHLSGFAPEDEASFVGIVTALRADVPSQYSAWLSLVFDAGGQLPPEARGGVWAALAEGPRQDQAAIEDRLRSRVEVLDRASWAAYDRAIKSQGATDGVAGYGRVVQLLLSTGVLDRQGTLK